MRAGDEEVGTEVDDRVILDAETVHAVDAQQRPVRLVAPVVEIGERGGDLGDRQLDSRARVDPGHGDHPRARRDGVGEPADDLVDRRRGRLVVQLHPVDVAPVRSARSRSASWVA